MAAGEVKDFYTLATMGTFSGATGATFMVSNGVQSALSFGPRWLALAVAMVIVLGTIYLSGGRSVSDYAVGVVNAFLVYSAAAGATELAGRGRNGGGPGSGARSDPLSPPAKPRRRFLTSWFDEGEDSDGR